MPTGDDTRVTTLSILVDTDLTHSTGLPLLLLTEDTSLYSHAHPKYTRVQAAYQANGAAQTIVLFDDQPSSSAGRTETATLTAPTASSVLETSSPIRCVDVFAILEPTQVSSALHLTNTAAAVSDEACAYTSLSRYLDTYLRAVIAAAVVNARHRRQPPTPCTVSGSASCAPQAVDVTVHVLVCPNITEASMGTNMTNANLSAKESALFMAAIQSVEQQWVRAAAAAVAPCEGMPHGLVNDQTRSCVRHTHIGFCGTVPSPERATSIVLAVANKRLKTLREQATTAPTTTLVEQSDTAGAQPLGPLTADMVRPDVTRKCEPNDFVKLYQNMLSEVVSVSDRRAMAALATFPTMHHLLTHVHNSLVEGEAGEGDGKTDAAVYTRNYGEERHYNVVNEAVVEALSCDYRTQA